MDAWPVFVVQMFWLSLCWSWWLTGSSWGTWRGCRWWQGSWRSPRQPARVWWEGKCHLHSLIEINWFCIILRENNYKCSRLYPDRVSPCNLFVIVKSFSPKDNLPLYQSSHKADRSSAGQIKTLKHLQFPACWRAAHSLTFCRNLALSCYSVVTV